MGTPVVRMLREDELARMPDAKERMAATGVDAHFTRFTFLATFDGTNNHKDDLDISGDQYQTSDQRSQSSRSGVGDNVSRT